MLIKAKQSWIVPAVAILGLIGYHNERKDKDFLLLQTKDAIALFRVEYLLIGFPFILIECLRSRFPEAGAMIVTSLLLPKLKAIKWKSIADIESFFYEYRLPSSYRTYLIPSVVLSFVPIIVVAQRCSSSLPSFPFSFFSSSFMRNNLSLPKFISITTFLGESIW